MELLLALPAGKHLPTDRKTDRKLTPAHMAYRIGRGPRLMAIRSTTPAQNGVMMVDCIGFEGDGDPTGCCRQILGECKRRRFSGIICDFEGLPNNILSRLVSLLNHNCPAQGLALYVPEAYASQAPESRVLIPSALTSGTLERRLRTAAGHYGAGRLALAVEWLREDFPLPASGRGDPLTGSELEEQLRRLEPAVFFDRGLCAHYYTYMNAGQAHFVLFDTPHSVREKLAVARRLGISSALLPPEAADLSPDSLR